MPPHFDLHFHLRAACWNSKWCRSKLAHGLQTGTVFSGVSGRSVMLITCTYWLGFILTLNNKQTCWKLQI